MPKLSTITEWSITRSTGDSGLILGRIAAQRHHRVAHGRQIDHGGNAGEVLHQHAGRAKGDLALGLAAVAQPLAHRLDVVDRDRAPVFPAQQVLEQHLQRKGQPADIAEPGLGGRLEAVIVVFAPFDIERAAGLQGVLAHLPSPGGAAVVIARRLHRRPQVDAVKGIFPRILRLSKRLESEPALRVGQAARFDTAWVPALRFGRHGGNVAAASLRGNRTGLPARRAAGLRRARFPPGSAVRRWCCADPTARANPACCA